MSTKTKEVTPERIRATERLIRPYIRRTPVIETSAADFGLDPANLFFKLELCQYAGSFKVRGAFTNLLSREVPSAGVVAASGGNHGVAVAFAANKLAKPARILCRRWRRRKRSTKYALTAQTWSSPVNDTRTHWQRASVGSNNPGLC